MTDRIFIATYDSRHFEFMAVADSAARAIDVCAQGLRIHADQCGIPTDWWWDELYADEAEAMRPVGGAIQVREMQVGEPYRDGSILPYPAEK